MNPSVNKIGDDYFNALAECNFLPQYDHDPRKPAYVATQGPLAHTVSDFWQVSSLP